MPVTNFFAHLAAIPFEGCLNITLKKRDGEQLTVSVLLQNEGCGDAAKNHIPPLILKGSAKELCEGFFDAVTAPLAETSQLLVNMEQFLKGQETAKKNAAMEKKKTEKVDKADKSDKPTTPEEIKEMKYKGVIAEVDKLEAAGKYREAWIKVPQASEFPNKTEEMQKRRSSLSAKFSPDLFGAEQPAPAVTNVEPKTEQNATDRIDAEVFLMKDNGNEFALTDPDPKWSIEAVMHFYATTYPTLTTAKTVGPEITNDTVQYRFETTMGTKG